MSRFDDIARARAVADQAAAADPRVSAWVEANAGSGKTRLLTDRVARLLLSGAAPERILCLTYTKAAAGEMGDRLFALLSAWATAEDAALSQMLGAGEGALTPEVAADARRLFARALETPGGLKIQTIHAFCEQVLRRFPLEAGAPAGFRTLEDDEAKALKRAARDAVLSGQEGGGGAEFDRALERVFDTAQSDRVDDALEAAWAAPPDAAEMFRSAAGLDPADHCEVLSAAAWSSLDPEGLNAVRAALIEAGPRAAATARAIDDALRATAEGDPEGAWRTWAGRVLKDDGSQKRLQDVAPSASGEAARTVVAKAMERTKALDDRVRAIRRAEATDALFMVAKACRTAYERRKRGLGALDFADLVTLTADLLQSEAGAWARWRLDRGVDHILVDEAQDNSPEQWAVISGLSQEFFADPAGPVRTILGVGDVKQSIYRFQGAAPEAFFAAGADYGARARGLERAFLKRPLEVSFRSACEILEAVDHVCADPDVARALTGAMSAPEIAMAAGAPETKFAPVSTPHRAARLARGRVELWDLVPAEKPDEKIPFHAPLDDARRTGHAVDRLADRIASDILERIDAGEVLPSKAEGPDHKDDPTMRPRDVLILVRSRGALYAALIRALRTRGVAVAGQDRFVVSKSLAVQDMTALASALVHRDDYALACLLRSPIVDLSETALQDVAHDRRGASLRAALAAAPVETWPLRDREAAAHAESLLADLDGLWRSAGPFHFFSTALHWGAPSVRSRLTGRLGAEAEDALEELSRQALAFERAGGGVADFLIRLQKDEASVKREFDRSRDEVRVMTVHGAKGLEAPVVYLPDTTSTPKARSSPVLRVAEGGAVWAASKAEDDERCRKARMKEADLVTAEQARLLYVAMTRAADRLVIAGAAPRSGAEVKLDDASWRAIADRTLGPHLEDEGDGVRALGAAFPRRPRGAVPSAARAAAPPDFRPIAPAAPRRVIRPSEQTGESVSGAEAATAETDPEDRARARRRGEVLHALLERLPVVPYADRAAAGARMLSRLGGNPTREDRDAWLAEALAVLSEPAFAPVFTPEARAEAAVSAHLPDGRRIVGRVDRLIVTEDECLIVDYKSGRPPAGPLSEKNVVSRQMAAYRAALRLALPGRAVRCAVLWTRAPRLEILPDAILDAASARVLAVDP